jgi:hypothetical protein
MRNVASISSMSHSVTREWIDRRSMIRSTANSIHELSTRGGLAQPLVTEGAGLVVGIADLDPSGLSPLVIQRALVSVPQVSYTRSHDVQSEKERLLLACAVTRRRFPVGASPTRQPLQPEAIGAVMEVTKWLKPSISVSRIGDSASVQAATRVNVEQASKRTMCRPTRLPYRGRLKWLGELSEDYALLLHRGIGGGMYTRKAYATREAPWRGQR